MNESKFKRFWKANKKKIILVVGGVVALKILNVLLQKAFISGGRQGFHLTIEWFDQEFDGLKLKEMYDAWALANPDKLA